jgi:hypothetical protein
MGLGLLGASATSHIMLAGIKKDVRIHVDSKYQDQDYSDHDLDETTIARFWDWEMSQM